MAPFALSKQGARMNERDERSRLMVRLPADLKAWLAAEAVRNGASQNSEIVRAVRERMERLTSLEFAASAN